MASGFFNFVRCYIGELEYWPDAIFVILDFCNFCDFGQIRFLGQSSFKPLKQKRKQFSQKIIGQLTEARSIEPTGGHIDNQFWLLFVATATIIYRFLIYLEYFGRTYT